MRWTPINWQPSGVVPPPSYFSYCRSAHRISATTARAPAAARAYGFKARARFCFNIVTAASSFFREFPISRSSWLASSSVRSCLKAKKSTVYPESEAVSAIPSRAKAAGLERNRLANRIASACRANDPAINLVLPVDQRASIANRSSVSRRIKYSGSPTPMHAPTSSPRSALLSHIVRPGATLQMAKLDWITVQEILLPFCDIRHTGRSGRARNRLPAPFGLVKGRSAELSRHAGNAIARVAVGIFDLPPATAARAGIPDKHSRALDARDDGHMPAAAPVSERHCSWDRLRDIGRPSDRRTAPRRSPCP